jgi:hypothetical protein
MIYSNKHNFLLLKNYKVGGTSLEVELSQILEESAIVTPIDPPNELHKPRNFDKFYNHISYKNIEDIIGKDVLDKSRSVVFVRNPFDVVLSHMYMSFYWSGIKNPKRSDVSDYFENKTNLNKITSLMSRSTYAKDNVIMAKTVYKYEDGLEQINETLEKVGIDKISIKAKEKKYKPKDIRPLDVFTSDQIKSIREDWAWEIDKFGYSPVPVVL